MRGSGVYVYVHGDRCRCGDARTPDPLEWLEMRSRALALIRARCVRHDRVICTDCTRGRQRRARSHGVINGSIGRRWKRSRSYPTEPAANCEPSPDDSDVANFRGASVHLRPALSWRYRILFFYRFNFLAAALGGDDRFGETYRVIWKSQFFCYWFFLILFVGYVSRIAGFSVRRSLVQISPLYDCRWDFFFFTCRFFLRSAALYSRMFIWRICIMYACCGTPLGSAL